MTRNEMRKMLSRYKGLHMECEQLKKKIRDKHDDMCSVRAIVTDSIHTRSGEVHDRVEQVIEQMDGMVRYYLEKVGETERAEQAVIQLIESLSDSEKRTVLFLHYIEGHTVEEISEIIPYSIRWIWYCHNDALDELCAIYEEKLKRPVL